MFGTQVTRKEQFLLKSIFYLFKSRGIATITFGSLYPHQPLFRPSKIGILFNVLFVCYILVTYILTIPYYYVTDSVEKLESERIIDLVHTGFGSLTAAFILAIFCLRQSTTAEIANRICTIAERCAILTDQRFDARKAFWRSARSVLLANAVLWFFLFATINTSAMSIIVFSLRLQLCNFVSNALFVQYTIVVRMIEELYEAVNDSLVVIMQNAQLKLTCSKDSLWIRMDKLSRAQELHSLLSKLCRDVSDFYSQPMLPCTLNIFTLLILCGYYVAKPIVLGHNSLPAVTYTQTVLYLLLIVVSLVMFARSVTKTIEEVPFFFRV